MKCNYCHACSFTENRQWLELYEVDSNLQLHPPRAQRPDSERILGRSNYRLLVLSAQANQGKLSTWTIFRAVEELVKIYAPKNWGRSFVQELNQAKKRGSMTDDVDVTAQYLCKCWSSAIEILVVRVRVIVSLTVRQAKMYLHAQASKSLSHIVVCVFPCDRV